MSRFIRYALAFSATALLPACAHVPRDAGEAEVAALLDARAGRLEVPARESDSAWIDVALRDTLSRDDAVRIALTQSPRVRVAYARLGFARTDVLEAGRLSDATLSLAFLRGGPLTQITRGIVLPFTEILMLPARRRLAAGTFDAAQYEIAATLLDLARDTETAWYRAVGARQIAAMRDATADAAMLSAELAQRYFDAGNIAALALSRELVEASEARMAATRAHRDAARAQLDLLTLLGIADGRELKLPAQLPLPPDESESLDVLLAQQRELRADIAASRARVGTLDGALRVARHWRFIGHIDVGYEREREADGERLRGPTLELAIPLFRHGTPAIARAQASLDEARAQLAQNELAASNALREALDASLGAREIVREYREHLLPQREAVVARTQERVNYMLVGAFELLLAKRDTYSAYQGYVEAVRDYWLARADLRRAAGGALPLDGTEGAVETPAPRTDPSESTDHTHHGHALPEAPLHGAHDSHEPSEPGESDDASASPEHQHHQEPRP
jgi:cobalt-zinc-cadmium efflux system outer membrane protein